MDFIRPQNGEIQVFGLDSRNDSVAIKNTVGFLSSDSILYPKWSGDQYLAFLAKMRGPADMTSLIKRLDLDPSIQYRHLSSGNKQKLALVVAMYGMPKLLVMDEPTKALDPLLQQEIYTVLHEYRRDGGTVFVSSHNLPEVEKICDRVAVIKEGKIVANETMQSIREMAIHIISISTAAGIKQGDFELPNVEITHASEKHMLLKVKGDLNPVLHVLNKYKLKDLEVNHANLEDIFLEYYK